MRLVERQTRLAVGVYIEANAFFAYAAKIEGELHEIFIVRRNYIRVDVLVFVSVLNDVYGERNVGGVLAFGYNGTMMRGDCVFVYRLTPCVAHRFEICIDVFFREFSEFIRLAYNAVYVIGVVYVVSVYKKNGFPHISPI